MNEDRTRREFLGLWMAAVLAVTVCPANTCRRRPVRTDTQIETDNTITLEVRRALTDEPTVDAFNITVHTENRIVKLSGSVGSEEAKQAAKRIAAAVSNVIEVNDEGLVVQRR